MQARNGWNLDAAGLVEVTRPELPAAYDSNITHLQQLAKYVAHLEA